MSQLSNVRRTIKNGGGLGISSFLRDVKLTSDDFIDGGRSLEYPGSRTKYSVPHRAADCVNFLFALGPSASFP